MLARLGTPARARARPARVGPMSRQRISRNVRSWPAAAGGGVPATTKNAAASMKRSRMRAIVACLSRVVANPRVLIAAAKLHSKISAAGTEHPNVPHGDIAHGLENDNRMPCFRADWLRGRGFGTDRAS